MTSSPTVFINPIKDKMRKITFDDLIPVSDNIIGQKYSRLSISDLHRHTLDDYITKIKNIPGVDEYVKNEMIADCKKYLLCKEEVDKLEEFHKFLGSRCHARGINIQDGLNEYNKKKKDALHKLGRLTFNGGYIHKFYPRTAVTHEEAILLEAALIKFQHDRGLRRWRDQFPYRVIRPALTAEELAKIVV